MPSISYYYDLSQTIKPLDWVALLIQNYQSIMKNKTAFQLKWNFGFGSFQWNIDAKILRETTDTIPKTDDITAPR